MKEDLSNKYPNLFIIGFPKSGSTALAKNLSKHKDFFMPEYGVERFFDHETYYDETNKPNKVSFQEYLFEYSNASSLSSKYRVDPCLLAIYRKESIEKIISTFPNSKFIVLLRDPVESSVSMFKQRLSSPSKKTREISNNFMDCWNLIEQRKSGTSYPKNCINKFLFRYDLLYSYELYLPYAIELLGENLFIGFYDEYLLNPKSFFGKLSRFLDVDFSKLENKKYNVAHPAHPNYLVFLLSKFASYTLAFRKKLGIENLFRVRSLFNFRYKATKIDIEVDKSVYDYFNVTNKYIENLKK